MCVCMYTLTCILFLLKGDRVFSSSCCCNKSLSSSQSQQESNPLIEF